MTASNQDEVTSKKKGKVSDVKQWHVDYVEDPSRAAEYLNDFPIAGPGEAIAALRPDGSVIVWQLF
jgi:hypothetical protein